jgi:uncharacterized protein with GYD domain
MPFYMTQFTYTSEGWRMLVRNPQDRTEAFRTLLRRMGGELSAHYLCFGEYDSVLIAEAPNEMTMTSVLLSVIAEGDIKEMKTTVLITPEQGVEAMRKARGVEFPRPSG